MEYKERTSVANSAFQYQQLQAAVLHRRLEAC